MNKTQLQNKIWLRRNTDKTYEDKIQTAILQDIMDNFGNSCYYEEKISSLKSVKNIFGDFYEYYENWSKAVVDGKN